MSVPNTPPTLPEVYDEAGDSPRWLPALGLGLFALFALFFAVRFAAHTTHEDVPPSAAPVSPDNTSAPEVPTPPLAASS